MTQQEIQTQLKEVEAAIANLNTMVGTLSEAQLEASLAPLKQKREELKAELAQLTYNADVHGGVVAQGDHATAVAEGGVNVKGDVQGPIITGSGNTIITGQGAASASPPLPPQFTPLRKLMMQYFDLGELRTIAFDLGISYDDLRGSTRSEFVESLIGHCHRNGKLSQLLTLCRQQRGFVDWPNVS